MVLLMSQLLDKSVLQGLFDLRVERRVGRRLDHLLAAFAAKQINDQNAVVTIDKRVDRHRICALVFHRTDLFAASGAIVAVVEPTALDRCTKTHLGLSKKHVHYFLYFIVWHNDPVNLETPRNLPCTAMDNKLRLQNMLSLQDAIRPTTIIRSSKLNDHLGLDLTIASETFQHTGSFKFRAAYNVVLNNDNEEFIGVSSGNFGQALAYACKLLNRKCTVIMPANSASVKVDAVRAFGATADLIDVNVVSRAERLKQLAAEQPNAYLASAYDDVLVIDGNSTLGDELAEHNFDAVVVPIGGGGLISGIIQSLCRLGKLTEVVGAEPAMANDAARSLRAGELIANESEPQTIADGTRTLSLGKINWPIVQNGLKTIIEVSEDNIKLALKLYFGLVNLKCEPTGALSLGAVVERPEIFADKKLCVVVSGGNVDPAVYTEILTQR